MIKRRSLYKDKGITFIYAPNTGAPKYIKQILTHIQEDINNNMIIDFNTPLTLTFRSERISVRKYWS